MVRGKGQGGAKGLQKEASMGQRSPFLWRKSQNRRGAEGGPRAARGLPSTRGPGRAQTGLHLWGLPLQLALQVLRDQVGLVMLGEMVTPHEALLTLGTLKAFVPWEEEMPVTNSHVHTRCQSQKRRVVHVRREGTLYS